MKKLVFAMLSLLTLCSCSSDEPAETPVSAPVEINWSLSGVFGNAIVDSVKTDTELRGMVKWSDSSTMHLNGFDTIYFEKKIMLKHLQINAGAEVNVDDNGYFTFDNLEVFGLCENTNSVKIIPIAKSGVRLKPSSLILYSYSDGYYQYQ